MCVSYYLLLSWRVIKNIVVLREWSLHETLAGNGVRLQFPGTFSPNVQASCLLLTTRMSN